MQILIAEDDEASRFLLQNILENLQFQVIATADGKEAWETLNSSSQLHIAILDWEMPKLNGVEICRRLKNLERDTPVYVIILTGRDTKEDIVEGLDAGADDYITKPFDINELRSRINVAVRMVRTQVSLAGKVVELEEALDHVKTLQGIIPICMHCHKIRNDHQAWDRLEIYIANHSEAQFSHSICPDCLEEHYPEDDIED